MMQNMPGRGVDFGPPSFVSGANATPLQQHQHPPFDPLQSASLQRQPLPQPSFPGSDLQGQSPNQFAGPGPGQPPMFPGQHQPLPGFPNQTPPNFQNQQGPSTSSFQNQPNFQPPPQQSLGPPSFQNNQQVSSGQVMQEESQSTVTSGPGTSSVSSQNQAAPADPQQQALAALGISPNEEIWVETKSGEGKVRFLFLDFRYHHISFIFSVVIRKPT